ncbi:MAG: cupredoxin domain-containing protein [Acidimicrobiia bacterium]
MFDRKNPAVPILATLLLLVVSACGGAVTPNETIENDGDFGSPAEPTEADRVIEITATDQLVFEPADVTVSSGETITFRIVNQGNLLHDFTLGDQATQDEHEAEMAAMGGMAHDLPNVVNIPAGQTVELTWSFPDGGIVLIGCHQPGHYPAGMKGRVFVEA